jgi:hypothetical protein
MSSNRFTLLAALGFLLSAPLQVGAQNAEAGPTVTQPADSVAHLLDVLLISDVVEIMRLEGLEYGAQMQEEMFAGNGGSSWQAVVELIYQPAAMRKRFDDRFAAEFASDAQAVTDSARFFDSPIGRKIITLEVEARRSMMDTAVEEAARARFEDMEAEKDSRMTLLRRFSDVNDLIEANVAGALNANLAFFQGMTEVGSLGEDMTEDQMLTDVWAQEPDIRKETEEWLFPYLALAYGPLTDSEMQSYVAFSETKSGQKLNNALFAAFDHVFTTISRDLGRAAARQMMGEDI